MPRSKWKLPYIDPTLFHTVANYQRTSDDIHRKDPFQTRLNESSRKRPVKIITNSRSSIITDAFCGLVIQVHNGIKYQSVRITPQHIGKKLGEFSHTRKVLQHKELKKKKVPGKK